jgi:hypothetical protein
MAHPTLTELRARCNARGIVWSVNLTQHQLITLLAPSYDDRSLDAAIERDFLGLDVPPTPMAMLPVRVVNAPRAPRNNPPARKHTTSPVRLFQLGDQA